MNHRKLCAAIFLSMRIFLHVFISVSIASTTNKSFHKTQYQCNLTIYTALKNVITDMHNADILTPSAAMPGDNASSRILAFSIENLD